MLFNLVIMPLYHDFFFFFLILDLYFLIFAAIAQTLNLIAEFVIPVGIPTKEDKTSSNCIN